MPSNLRLKNNIESEFKIEHSDNTGAISVTSKELASTKLISTIAELKLIDGNNIDKLNVLGYYAKGDGGGGLFYWDNVSTETDNGGTIIAATGVATGRWKRVYSGSVNVKWFGAKGDGATDDTLSIQTAIDSDSSTFIPNGTYRTDNTITVNNGKIVKMDIKGVLKRITLYSSNTTPVMSLIDSNTVFSGGKIISENNSPSGVVTLGHLSQTDNRNAWWWKFSECTVYANDDTSSINIAVWSGQPTYSTKANYFGTIENINVYGGNIGLLLSEMSNAHNISNIQFWHQKSRGLQLRGAYGNNINNLFFHESTQNGMYSVHIANKTVGAQDSTFNNIIGFVSETGRAGDLSLVIDSNGSNNRVIFGSNVSGGWADNNGNNFVIASNAYNKPQILGVANIFADTTATALAIRGRNSDNISVASFKSYDGVTQFGYIQSRGNGEMRLVSSATPNIITFYADANETFRAQVGGIAAGADNARTCGTASLRWSTIYAGTGTINTSDDREKTYIDITETEKKVALELKANMKKFKFNDSVIEKGEDNSRIHFGTSAQTVKSIFEKYKLNPFNYALICYDEWEEQKEVKDDDGNIIQEFRESGNRYGIRYEELLCFIMSAL